MMNEEELKTLYNKVFDRWTYARQNCASLHNDADHFYNVYYSWEHKDDYGYSDNYDPAIGYRNIENSRAFMRCNVLEPGISSVRQEDGEKAAVMNSVIKADYATADIQKAMDKLWNDMLITGTGVLKLGWSFEEKSFWRWVETDEELMSLAQEALGVMLDKKPDDELTIKYKTIVESGDINLIKEFLSTGVIPNLQPENGYTGFKVRDIAQSDRPCFEIVPIQDVAWLGSGDSIRKVDCIFRRFYVTRDQLIAWQASGAPDWFNLQRVIDTCSEGFGQATSSIQQVDISNGRNLRTGMMIPLIEETRRDPRTGIIWETVINENSSTVVRHRKMPYFHNEYPYFSIRIFGSASDFAGISMFAPLESSIGEYIKVYNEILENGQLAINKVFLTRFAGRNSAPQLHFYAGNLIASEGYDDIRPLDIPDLRPSSMALLDRIKQEMEEITGCPTAMTQAQPDASGGNAGAVEQFQFFQTARFAAVQHQIAVELSALTMQMVKLHQQYDFEGRNVYVEDSEKGDRWVYYKPSDYAGQFVANSDPRSMLPTHNAVKRAQLLSAYNMLGHAKIAAIDEKTGQPISELIINPYEIVREILGTFDMLGNSKLLNKHGEITCLDANALPPVPQPTQEEVAQGQQDNSSPNNIPPEAMANLQAVSEQMGIPVEALIERGQEILGQNKAQAQAPIEVQGGAEVSPELAYKMGGGDMSNIQVGSGQNNTETMTGTNGMPPIKGGPQQHASGEINPQNVPNPQTMGAASQSAYSLQ